MKCTNLAPAGFSGHWREWHRGHGCELDPEPKVGADHYRLLIKAIDEAESELAVRANEYVAALRADNDGSLEWAVQTAFLALKRACIARVDVFDKVFDALGIERAK